MAAINILARECPDLESELIEVQTDTGSSIRGEWRQRNDGMWVLRVTDDDVERADRLAAERSG